MDLRNYFDQLTPEKRVMQFGRKTDEPLRLAFDSKRVVHAAMGGSMVPPPMAQKVWRDIMAKPVEGHPTQMAYIHIPFCKTKCLYCPFFQNGTNQDEEDRYIDHLVKDIEMGADSPRLSSAPIQAVFIGGGTPTSLSPENAGRLLSTIQRCLPLANDYELTFEGRVHDLVPEKMDVWFRNGVNRMSLGVQSFDTKVRQAVGRIDDGETVFSHLQELLSYNQCAVVIDLMYGLPYQTMDVWHKDVETLVESGIDGADLYQLNVFEHSDLNLAIQRGKLPPAAPTQVQSAMFSFGKNYLDAQGYKRLSFCHWARNNRERSLYNTQARFGTHLFPFGCGAGGHVDGLSTMFDRRLPAYEKAIDEGRKPMMFLMNQSPNAHLKEDIQGQMNQSRLDLDKLIQREEKPASMEFLGPLSEDYGLWKHNGYLYQLTEAGQFWQVNMTQTLLESVNHLMGEETEIQHRRIAAQG